MAEVVEAWQRVWEKGIAPQVSVESLLALRKGIMEDDQRLLQGATTSPPPLHVVQDWPVERADAITYMRVMELGGFGDCTVGEAEEWFARTMYATDQLLGEPAGCRWWLLFWDNTPRDELFKKVLPLINRSLAERNVV